MISFSKRPVHFTRRDMLRTAGTGLLAAPALIVATRFDAAASTLTEQVMCPEVSCGYRYNPSVGDPDFGIPPGTAFEDLPDDWECPECGTAVRLW